MLKPSISGVITADSYGAKSYRRLMGKAVDVAGNWLGASKMISWKSPDILRNELKGLCIFPSEGVGEEQSLLEAQEYFLNPSLQVHNPYCMAHLHCPTTYASQMAEVIMNVSNQSMDSWDQSPSATIIEQAVIDELRQRIGYGPGCAGVFTSGGTQSNLMGLLLARDRYALDNWGVDVKNEGLPAEAQKMVVICSDQAHFSVYKSLAILGLGASSVVPVKCLQDGSLDAHELLACLQKLKSQSLHPFAIVATVGTTDRGAIDPILEISEVATNYGLWLHVDAAWGGALLFSHKYKNLIRGVEKANSVTLDFHKHFFQTISCGAFLIQNPNDFDLVRMHADYLNPNEDELEGIPNLVSKSLQTTRRFDALKLLMSMRSIGTNGYGRLIDRTIDLAHQFSMLIGSSSFLELLCSPKISSVLFRLRREFPSYEQADVFHRRLAQDLFERGLVNLGVTRYLGKISFKITLLNPETTIDDLRKVLQIIMDNSCTQISREEYQTEKT